MFSFFKKKEPEIKVPEWSRFDSTEDYLAFKNALMHYFRHENVQFDFDAGIISGRDIEKTGVSVLNMVNLSKYCSGSPAGNYQAIIARHIGKLHEHATTKPDFEDFATVRPALGLRILTDMLFELMPPEAYIGNTLFVNLFYFLVYDLPDTVYSVKREDANRWGISYSELLTIGKENIELKYPQTITTLDILDLQLWVVHRDHFYAPNILFDIDDYPELVGTSGSLVAVPNGDRVLIYPIEGIEVTSVIGKLAATARFYYEEKPNPITPHMYWYFEGDFIHIPYNPHKPDFTLLPEEFVNMLRDLNS